MWRSIVNAFRRPPHSWDDASEVIVPFLRGPHDVKSLPHRRVALGLFVTLAAEVSESLVTVTEEHLATWGVSFDEALVVAQRNLVYRGHPTLPLSPGLWTILSTVDDVAASRVLMPSLLRSLCAKPIVGFPDRDLVMVADSTNQTASEALLAVLSSPDNRTPITRRVYALGERSLQAWVPPATYDRETLREYVRVVEAELAR